MLFVPLQATERADMIAKSERRLLALHPRQCRMRGRCQGHGRWTTLGTPSELGDPAAFFAPGQLESIATDRMLGSAALHIVAFEFTRTLGG